MKCVFLVFLNVLLCTAMVGQSSLEGCIVGSKNEPLVGASVVLLRKSDSTIVKGTVSNRSGDFKLKEITPGKYLLKISYLGYLSALKHIDLGSSMQHLGNLNMKEKSTQLSDVVVKSRVPIVEVNGDTTEFRSSSFKVNADAVAEDLISKLPGVTIESGTVKANGEEVKQVLVDGKEFFGTDASIALKNLPAEVIDKVQVYDKASEQAAFTGFKDGDTSKTINIKTKKGKSNGLFGKLLLGYGSDDRYKLNGNLNLFNGTRRISLVGSSNNVNEQNFSSQDVLGLGKAGSMPSPPGSNEGGSSSMLGENTGINTNHSLGVNYSDSWGKKWTATGSYFFNRTDNSSHTVTDRTYLQTDSTNQYYKANTSSNTQNYNHRVNARLECKIDENSSLTIQPVLSFQKNNVTGTLQAETGNSDNTITNNTNTNYVTTNSGYDFSNSVFYRHKFEKKGRTFFVDFSQNAEDKDGTNKMASTSTNLNSQTKSSAYGVTSRFSYTEPLGEYSLLMVNYAPSITKSESDKNTKLYETATNDYTLLDSTLSNNYGVTNTTKKLGLGYLLNRKKVNLNVGADYQTLSLNGEETFPRTVKTKKDYRDGLIRSDLFYTINKRTFLHIGYNTETKAPSLTQLQAVTDNSNALSISTGNPDLDMQYTHALRCMFRAVDYTLTRTFFFATHANFSNNYIGSSSFTAKADTVINGTTLASGAQLTQPVNLSGYAMLSSNMGYSFPFYLIKSNVNLNGEYSYTQLPGLISGQKNYATTNAINGGITIASNISENVDFNLSYRGNYNMVNNSLQSSTDQNYYIGTASAKLNLVPLTHWVLTTDANLNHYSGLGEAFDQPVLLWNASIAYKFLKNNAAEIRFTVYDLLNKNSKTTRTVSSAYIETSQSETLKRYFLVSFCYNLRNFKSL